MGETCINFESQIVGIMDTNQQRGFCNFFVRETGHEWVKSTDA
jgi:hypothetical protein